MSRRSDSRARFVTQCPDCAQEVGVTQDKFNRVVGNASWRSHNVWRSVVHRNKATSARCSSARSVVPEALVWERETADA